MIKSRFTEVQVVQPLQKLESGVATGAICHELGIVLVTFYKWKAKYWALDLSDVEKLKTLEEEYSRLKRMYLNSEPSTTWTIVPENLWLLRSMKSEPSPKNGSKSITNEDPMKHFSTEHPPNGSNKFNLNFTINPVWKKGYLR